MASPPILQAPNIHVLVVMAKLRKKRHQHTTHSGQGITHLRALGFSLRRDAAICIAIKAMIVLVATAVFLHSMHGNISILTLAKTYLIAY